MAVAVAVAAVTVAVAVAVAVDWDPRASAPRPVERMSSSFRPGRSDAPCRTPASGPRR